MKKNNHNNQDFEEVQLVKQTLMAAAFPALVTSYKGEEEEEFVKGFLPGFKDNEVSDMLDENECVEYLQDLLDDKVEELITEGKQLPDIEEDEELLKKNPGYKIVYLDINVYALPEECHHHCHECSGECDCDEDDDCCDCDENCDCGCEGEGCNCGEDCHCTEENHCSDNCGCWKK